MSVSASRRASSFWPWVTVLALATLAFALACRVATPTEEGGGSMAVNRMLVASRMAMSDSLFEEADVFFHRGVEHESTNPVPPYLFRRVGEILAPCSHVHREGTEVKEIMPWLRLATRVNPRNVTAYRVAAFWMAGELARPDLARQLLLEAAVNNPGDYRIQIALGRVHVKNGKLDEARRSFDRALRLWPKPTLPEDDQARLDKGEILLFLGLLREAAGDRKGAVQAFADMLVLFPSRSGSRARAEDLQAGREPAVSAVRLLEIVMRRHSHMSASVSEEEMEGGHPHRIEDKH